MNFHDMTRKTLQASQYHFQNGRYETKEFMKNSLHLSSSASRSLDSAIRYVYVLSI